MQTNDAGSVLASLPSALPELQAMWEEKGIEWRRAVLGAVVESVTILPARCKGAPFTVDRVEIPELLT